MKKHRTEILYLRALYFHFISHPLLFTKQKHRCAQVLNSVFLRKTSFSFSRKNALGNFKPPILGPPPPFFLSWSSVDECDTGWTFNGELTEYKYFIVFGRIETFTCSNLRKKKKIKLFAMVMRSLYPQWVL